MSIAIIQGQDAVRAHVAGLRAREEKPLPQAMLSRLCDIFGREISAEEAVAQIIADVQRDGDAALRDYTQRIDGVSLDGFAVDSIAIEAAYSASPVELREALHLAADRVRAFHEMEPGQSWVQWDEAGGALGQVIRPLHRVGIYAPGGTAAYPSSLLMAVIPAKVAGVEEILVATPPGPRGVGASSVLAAAHVAGVKRVFLLGGAQAVAAFAYGTESIPPVDKILGAGGLFVTLAKKQVYGDVGIDGLYGPTETLLIADDAANPSLVAADLLAQAEHDPLATALLITPSRRLGEAVRAEVACQLPSLSRREIIEQSLAGQGAILIVADLDDALSLANNYAPEHLCLLVAEPWLLVGKVQSAGGVFVGEHSSEALGDYVVGPSHIMPTQGTARFASPLHVRDFVKVTSIFAVGQLDQELSSAARIIAQAEGLTAHAAAIAARDVGPNR